MWHVERRCARMKSPERFETSRLILRRPSRADADAIFARYASDPESTRYLSWPRHVSADQTRAFLEFSEAEWGRWPAGPCLILDRESGRLLGGTGFSFETPDTASTGYVLARDAWGRGYATEALAGLMTLAAALGLRRVHALVHFEHAVSCRVLEKCGFLRDPAYSMCSDFPNLGVLSPQPTIRYESRL
jgi:ribosomal-protein-alanine N-acetyltransferase